jgi:hypothetical protein
MTGNGKHGSSGPLLELASGRVGRGGEREGGGLRKREEDPRTARK